ncbi:hypothetical protein SO802_027013 [Lithocarpus litseifolius]|uniref:Large ribosomal subunit protein bL12 C-terminal domain-containing protein n=1 Tax=Lithocarpus litseifolius TaxID=425828 RepID=A0AAW2C3E1_9ROSI
MGLNKYGPTVSGLGPSTASGSKAGSSVETKAAKKNAFDLKLEKYDAAAKIKIIKEVRTFTDLGLKEAKELVEKVPVVLKKGLTKGLPVAGFVFVFLELGFGKEDSVGVGLIGGREVGLRRMGLIGGKSKQWSDRRWVSIEMEDWAEVWVGGADRRLGAWVGLGR